MQPNQKNHPMSPAIVGSMTRCLGSMTRCQNCQNHATTANGSSPQNCQNHATTYRGTLLEQKMAAKFRGNGELMCRSKRECVIERD